MAVIGEAFVEVKPKTDNFAKESETGVVKGLDSLVGKAGALLGAGLAVGAIGGFAKSFVEKAAASNALTRVSAQLIQSTGGAANVTADQIGNLADKLQGLTGVDDDVIKSADNILLGFKNIKDSAGAGNDIFDRTTKAALDMSTVLGGDAAGAALQLGKALNDPTAGLGKLARAGVTFTDQQKEQIKTLQASGDILGAQKIILDEVQSEFGGAAEAAADPFKILAATVDDLEKSIGNALLPALLPAARALAGFVTDHTVQIAGFFEDIVNGITGAVKFLIPGLENVAGAFKFVLDQITPLVDKGKELLSDVLAPLPGSLSQIDGPSHIASTGLVSIGTALLALKVGGAIGSSLGPLVTTLTTLGGIASAPFVAIGAAFIGVAAAGEILYQKVKPVHDLLDELFGTLAPFVAPLLALGSPILIVAGAFKFLFDRVAPVRDALGFLADSFDSLVSTVSNIDFGAVFSGLTDKLPHIDFSGIATGLAGIVDTVKGVGGQIGDAFGTAIDAIHSSFAPAIEFLISVWAKYGDQVTGIVVGVRDIIVAIFNDIATVLKVVGAIVADVASVIFDRLSELAGLVSDAIGPAFQLLADLVAVAIAPIADIINTVIALITNTIQTFIAAVIPAWQVAWDVVSEVVANVIGPISDTLEGVLTIIQGFVDIIAGIFTGDWSRIWQGVQEIVAGVVEALQASFDFLVGIVHAVFDNIGEIITLPFIEAQTLLAGIMSGIQTTISGAVAAVLSILSSTWTLVTDLLTGPVQNAVGAVAGFIGQVVSTIAGLPGQAVSALASLAGDIAGVIADAASQAVSAAGTLVANVVTEIAKLPGQVVSALAGVGGQIIGNVKSVISGALNSAIDFINDHLPSIDIGPVHVGVPSLPHVSFAAGGIVPGTLGAAIPAIVHGGEVVLNAQEQARILMQLADGRRTLTGASGAPIVIDASITVNGSVLGVDLEAIMEQQLAAIADKVDARLLATGRR